MATRTQINNVKAKILTEESALSENRRNLASARTAMDVVDASLRKAYADLADVYIPDFTADLTVDSPYARINSIVQQLNDERRGRMSDLESLIEHRTARLSELETSETATETKLEQVNAENVTRRQVWETTLQGMTEYQEVKVLVGEIERDLAAQATVLTAAQARRNKFQPQIANDPIFQYFVKKEVHLQDSSPGLIGRIDRMMARVYGFARMMQLHDFYDAEVSEKGALVDQRRAALDGALSQQTEFESTVARKVGLVVSDEELAAVSELYQNQIKNRKQTQSELEGYRRDLEKLSDGRGKYFDRAITSAVVVLTGMTVTDIRQYAAKTADKKDDEIVELIGTLLSQREALVSQERQYVEAEKMISGVIGILESQRTALQRTYDDDQAAAARSRRDEERRESARRSNSYGSRGGGVGSSGGFGGGSSARGGF